MHLRLITFFCVVAFVVTGVTSQYAAIQAAKNSLKQALDRNRLKQFSVYKSLLATGKTAEFDSQKIIFEPRGMGPLYNATHVILDSVIGEKAFPDGLITVKNHELVVREDALDDWPNILKHYAAIITIVLFGLLFAIITPIVGFCFCCCRCAGSCGARSQPFDKKHDTCRRIYLGLMLILVATAMVFGVVVAFVTNSYMQEGVENAPQAARYVTKDATMYLNDTSSHMHHLLVDNYKELQKSLLSTLKDTANIVTQQLANESQIVSLAKLKEVSEMLPEVQRNLKEMKSNTLSLQAMAIDLDSSLRSVKNKLQDVLIKCENLKACKDLKNKYINDLSHTTMNYNNLPDTMPAVNDLDQFVVGGDLQNEIENGLHEFYSINKTFSDAVDNNMKPVEQALNNAGKEIQQQCETLKSTIDNLRGTAQNEGEKLITIADDFIKEYSQYRYYGGLAISIILLAVLLCVSFGLLCGICGKRPDGYGDDCCNKGAGSTFLMCAVALMFLSTIVLAVVALAHFVIGLLVHRAVCVPLQNPHNDQIFNLIEDFVDLDQIIHAKSNIRVKTLGALRLSTILKKCHQNESAYEVFSLDMVLSNSIEELLGYAQRFQISNLLQNIKEDFKLTSNITIVSQKGLQKLEDLEKSELSNFPFYKFTDNLNETLTAVNLPELAEKLDEVAGILDSKNSQEAQDLRSYSQVLKFIQKNRVEPMVNITVSLRNVAADLELQLKFNTGSFSEAIHQMTQEIIEAQKFLQTDGQSFVEFIMDQVITGENGVDTDIKNYLKYVVNQTKKNVGQCGPLSQVYNSTLTAVCNNVLDPFNGFWAGLGWCILLFVPCIILSVKLSSLYQKSDPYPGPLVESEYLYDAYADRDNISLTSPPEGKRRSKDKKHDRHTPRESTQGPSASHDHRYTDMARKQWDDYSEDAPPRYHSPPLPPSEYERPPPYYYPGPGSDRSPSVN